MKIFDNVLSVWGETPESFLDVLLPSLGFRTEDIEFREEKGLLQKKYSRETVSGMDTFKFYAKDTFSYAVSLLKNCFYPCFRIQDPPRHVNSPPLCKTAPCVNQSPLCKSTGLV